MINDLQSYNCFKCKSIQTCLLINIAFSYMTWHECVKGTCLDEETQRNHRPTVPLAGASYVTSNGISLQTSLSNTNTNPNCLLHTFISVYSINLYLTSYCETFALQ